MAVVIVVTWDVWLGLHMPQVELFLILDLLISLEQSQSVYERREELLKRTFRKSSLGNVSTERKAGIVALSSLGTSTLT